MCVKKMPQTANISAFTEVLTGFCENMTEAKILTFFWLSLGFHGYFICVPDIFCLLQRTDNSEYNEMIQNELKLEHQEMTLKFVVHFSCSINHSTSS